MRKIVLAASVAFMALTGGAEAMTWEVDSWPGGVDQIPCTEWTKTPDGTWLLKGSIKLGASIVDNIGVKGDAAARKLEKMCGK